MAHETCRRTRAVLVRHGLWKDDLDEPTATEGGPKDLADLYAASIRGVLLLGPRRGQRVVRFFGEAARRADPDQEPDLRPRGDAFNLPQLCGIMREILDSRDPLVSTWITSAVLQIGVHPLIPFPAPSPSQA